MANLDWLIKYVSNYLLPLPSPLDIFQPGLAMWHSTGQGDVSTTLLGRTFFAKLKLRTWREISLGPSALLPCQGNGTDAWVLSMNMKTDARECNIRRRNLVLWYHSLLKGWTIPGLPSSRLLVYVKENKLLCVYRIVIWFTVIAIAKHTVLAIHISIWLTKLLFI